MIAVRPNYVEVMGMRLLAAVASLSPAKTA